MRIVFMASGEFAIGTLRHLAQSDHEVAAVVTQPARGAGRGRRITPTPVHSLADEFDLPVFEADEVNHPDFVEKIRSLEADLGLIIAFGQKLGPELLAAIRGGCVNLHASLLPRYRGAAPINWAVVNGEEKTGVTVFKIVERMDAGPILTSRWTYLKPEETAGELHDRLAGIGVDAVRTTLDMFADGNVPEGEPQDEALATKAPKLTKKDGDIDFALPARRVCRHICGMTPWPQASARFEAQDGRWEKVAVVRARPAEPMTPPSIDPGLIDARLCVAAADGFIELLEIKPAAGRTMTWREYVNGRHVSEGDRFVAPE